MKLFSRNVRNYLISLAALVLCAGLYDAAARYVLRVPQVPVVTPRPPTQDPSAKEDLADLFPADAWQLGQCKRLLTGTGTLLFRDWRQISDSQWKLEPLTIVIGRGLADDDATASPIVMTAEEGAEIQFAESLDMTVASAPPIKTGRMIGDVVIQRAGKVEPSERLDVKTRNVWIDNRKVWTTESISMRIGRAKLDGRDLTIHLAASTATATGVNRPSTILDRLDLVYLEQLMIPLDTLERSAAGSPQEQVSPTKPQSQPQPERGSVFVHCRNGIKYDFAVDRLSLTDSVVMQRVLDGEVLDRFDCETLNLTLRDPANQAIRREGPMDWIDKVRASGRPARLQSRGYDFELVAETIDFDSVGGLLQADGEQGVVLRRGAVQAELKQLAYQYDPQQPDRVGIIDALGAGQVRIDDPSIMLRTLSWSRGFKLQPLQELTFEQLDSNQARGKLSVRIDGDVRARLVDGGTATAGSIEGVFKPADASAEHTRGTTGAASFVPEVVHAVDAVAVHAPQVIAKTEQLSLYFEQAADITATGGTDADAAGGNPAKAAGRPASSETTGGGLARWVRQPGGERPLRAPVARPRPEISGKLVSAKLLMTRDGIQAKDVSIKGNVSVKHRVRLGDTLLPLVLSGETMRAVRNEAAQSSGQDYLQVGSGTQAPAKLSLGDGFFIGPTIKVWPTDNVVQVDGAGEMRVPRAMLKGASPTEETEEVADRQSPRVRLARSQPRRQQRPASAASAASRVTWKSPPYCRWGESMQFDGQLAVFDGGVQIDADVISGDEPWQTRMTGQQMQIALARRIRLMDRDTLAATELSEIRLLEAPNESVVVRAQQLGFDETPEAIHLIHARRLDFSPRDGGQLLGRGPGWYRGWMLTDGQRSLVTPQPSENATPNTRVLQGVHLTFRDSMVGDLNAQTLAFTGGVRSGVRELDSWEDAVDVAEMERLAVGEMTMDCGTLRFGVTPMPEDLRRLPGMPTPWEMQAEGGVVVRTNTQKRGLIEGTATRASYESKKGWLVVEGQTGRGAFIRQTWPDGSPGYSTHAPQMSLNLKTFEFHSVLQDAQINPAPGR